MPRFSAAIGALACAAIAFAALPARAGTGLYDMSGILAEPHPFAAPAPPPPVLRRPGGTSADGTRDMSRALDAPHPFEAPRIAPAAGPAPPPRAAAAPAPQAAAAPPPTDADPTLLYLALGYYDINDNEEAAEFRVEWRGHEWWWKLKPLAGGMITSDGAAYGFGGIALDLELWRHLVLTPSFAAGLYADGGGKDLGSVIEFRSGIELAWRFDSGARAGLMLYHISNAGIDDNNPGTEVLSLGYAIPLD